MLLLLVTRATSQKPAGWVYCFGITTCMLSNSKTKSELALKDFFSQRGFTANGEWLFSGFNSGWWCFLFPGAGAVWSDWLCTLLNFSSVYKHAELNYTIKGSSCGWLALRYRISRIHWHKVHKAETSFLLNLKQNSFDMLLPFMCKLKRVKNVLNGLGVIVWTLE